MLWRMSVGIMFAGLDDRLHRHRSGALRADAPAADFAALCGAKEFPVTTGGPTRNSVSRCRRAELSNGVAWVRRKIKEGRKGRKGRKPSGNCQGICDRRLARR
jgi:hypothetical protein